MLISLLSVTAFAANTAELAGPKTVRAGDTITLTFKMNGSGLMGAELDAPSYDKSQLELVKKEQKIGGDWKVEFTDSRIVIYDDRQETPINKSTSIFSYTFKVKNLAVGTKITVSLTNVILSDGKNDASVGTVSYAATIAQPLSKDNALKSLTVSNATINPAFAPDITSYTAEVPFEVSKLNVSAVANDTKAKVSVNSPNLTPNGTTQVTVTVTAENGSTKVYTIAVKRANDPNYVPSSNNDLSGITVEGFLLSPVFSVDQMEYVVWLPYETESVKVAGTAADSLASVRVEGGDNLTAGADNVINVICVAEDGTEKAYTVVAKRAAAHGAAPDDPTQPSEPTEPTAPTNPTEPINPTTPNTSTEPTNPTPTTPSVKDNNQSTGGNLLLAVIVGVVCLAVGLVGGLLIGKKKR
jgi:hypothetical protein